MLNALYATWDAICERRGALGVDFSGSTYVAASGHDDNAAHLDVVLQVGAMGRARCRCSGGEGVGMARRAAREAAGEGFGGGRAP